MNRNIIKNEVQGYREREREMREKSQLPNEIKLLCPQGK